METLLAHSFDYLSSYEPSKVRKGLRQVEGLLAQICLSKSKQPASDKRRSLLSFGAPQPVPKALSELKDDPAFREFFKLQEGFQWNGTRRLSATLLTLVTALLDHPANTRTFEELDGLLTVTSLFKQRATSREVKLKLVEFLYFYLMPETPMIPAGAGASAANAAAIGLQRSPTKLGGPRPRSANGPGAHHGGRGNRDTRTTDEKQALLGRYLNNVEDLVEDLKETAPFGATVY
ncbi:unnamed protein product [Aspergillus oryzae]|uniref:Unnamed protein product n=2 Tax=Aspergillus oryzae TaxID=5062 RepID=A0AAN5BX20_ASPOZ|nr:unnamed protein product [Aspergillus oryzae]GMF88060.1 unnamed protein product [Aspergillus oryzae]GMG05299.1 unnamed protein product [Aspergillus oryzae]GMG28556.1 unnamed protein product [Aspergillus oryzae]GMG45698.1 unnamed protein product [Aspergillus oryzae var. brunneus]